MKPHRYVKICFKIKLAWVRIRDMILRTTQEQRIEDELLDSTWGTRSVDFIHHVCG